MGFFYEFSLNFSKTTSRFPQGIFSGIFTRMFLGFLLIISYNSTWLFFEIRWEAFVWMAKRITEPWNFFRSSFWDFLGSSIWNWTRCLLLNSSRFYGDCFKSCRSLNSLWTTFWASYKKCSWNSSGSSIWDSPRISRSNSRMKFPEWNTDKFAEWSLVGNPVGSPGEIP